MFEAMMSVKNLFYFFKLCGTVTMKLDVGKKDTGAALQFLPSRSGIVYNTFLIFFITSSFSIIYTYGIFYEYRGGQNLEMITYDATDASLVIITVYILVL